METPDTIRQFWFGLHADDAAVAQEQSKLWWIKNPATDEAIRQRFEAYVKQATTHALDDWSATPAGRLALILLTDQFPRNIYRNTPDAFASDVFALSQCKEGLREGVDRVLRPIERVFFYLPLEHAESLEDQEAAIARFSELVRNAAPEQKAVFDGFLDYAVRHREIIARFGRFPHRNRILGRVSTPEEIAFLKQPGSSF